MTVIYLDVLIALNLLIDYLLLLSAARLLNLAPKRLRVIAGALIGAASSALVLLPRLNGLLSLLINAGVAALMVLAACGYHTARLFGKTLLCFYAVSFSFSGIMYAVWYGIAPDGMLWRNGVVYFDISPILLIIMTILCYLILTLIHRLTGRRAPSKRFYPVEISMLGRSVPVRAMVDTGNSLVERISGAPVVVVEFDAIRNLLPEALSPIFKKGRLDDIARLEDTPLQDRFRMVPFSGLGSNGILPAFFPDKVTVRGRTVDKVCVAVYGHDLSSGSYHALIPPQIAELAELQARKKEESI